MAAYILLVETDGIDAEKYRRVYRKTHKLLLSESAGPQTQLRSNSCIQHSFGKSWPRDFIMG